MNDFRNAPAAWLVTCVLAATATAQAQEQPTTRVCVSVELRAWADDERDEDSDDHADPPNDAPEPGPATPEDEAFPELSGEDEDEHDPPAGPIRVSSPTSSPVASPRVPTSVAERVRAFDARLYLRRLLVYRITHRDGFEAVDEDCSERVEVEIYPIEIGWTLFARYSGTRREEKIDTLRRDELGAVAQRVVDALFDDVSLEETLTRRTVLRSDSEGELRRIHGDAQFQAAIGTGLVFGELPTARGGSVSDRIRVMAPLELSLGVRNRFTAWALDAHIGASVGTNREAQTDASRGHVEYGGGFHAALHFVRYLRPEAINSFYVGGGASFRLHYFRVLGGDVRGADGLFGGGLNLDVLLGVELMRASGVRFLVELQAHVPTYAIDSANDFGGVTAYLPGASVVIGLLI